MAVDIKVPAVGESISEVTLLKWIKQSGDYVERDDVLAEIESEKATFEVNADKAGILTTNVIEGDTVNIGDTIATIDDKAAKPALNEQEKTDKEKEALPKEEKPETTPTPFKTTGKTVEIKIPTVGESISEVTLLKWSKNNGDYVERDEVIAELESEKATFEVNAEISGIVETSVSEGDTLKIGDVIGIIKETTGKPDMPKAEKPVSKAETAVAIKQETVASKSNLKATPVASAIIADKKVDPKTVTPSGFSGKIIKDDVLFALSNPGRNPVNGNDLFSRSVRQEKMTNLRKTISRRLVESKNTTAMLTTFNEVDMLPIMDIRKKFKDKFKEIHGVNLGFMSFFAKACSTALAEWPSVNAYIDGDQLLYHDYVDISIAVSTPRGLTVPVIRNVESLSMADVEKNVVELATKARDSKLTAEDLTGGTFTITNGGVFGSLLSTPIINIPQSAILGMHKIQERPIAIDGQVVIRPMMYIALSYDHRIIDGRESVSFLVRIKELLENPALLLVQKDPIKTLLEL